MTKVLPGRPSLAAGVLAGCVGAVVVDAFIIGAQVGVMHQPLSSVPALFQFIASTLVGKVAFTSDAYVAVGIVLHFAVSVGWALGYAYLAERQPHLVARPIVSGLGFGVVVYFAMQLVLVAANAYQTPTPGSVLFGLAAHTAFFGIPVALIVARVLRAR